MVWSMMDIMLAVLFLLFALLFTLLGEKSANLISGFNMFTKEEREQYDQKRIVTDTRNSFLLWAGILAAGAALGMLFRDELAIAGIVVWVVVFFKDVHLDAHKTYEKYLKK